LEDASGAARVIVTTDALNCLHGSASMPDSPITLIRREIFLCAHPVFRPRKSAGAQVTTPTAR